MSSKYKFVKNCNIPEPPQAPIVVPDDFPINPLIALPPNPTIPLHLIAKFLPCKYPNRFPCPEIIVDNDGGPGGNSSVKYNCIDKSELIVDFDIESYCCDVIEDEDGNEVNHDKIIMTSHSELTLPYPPLIYPGYLYYFDRLEVSRYIANYNLTHVDQISLCDRCWLPAHLAGIRDWQRTSGLSNPNNYIWYVFTYDEDKDTRLTKQYLYPLIDAHRRYYIHSNYFREEEKIIASLDRCTCKATILSYTTECIAVVGCVRGTCNCSYAEITAPEPSELPNAPEAVTGEYFWGIEPDYPVEVNAVFTGYLSKRDNLVYAHVPREEEKKYIGVGTYQGNNYVTGVSWRNASGQGFSSTVEITEYNTAGDIPVGSRVVVEKTQETCSGTESNTASDAEYRTTLPAAALSGSNYYGGTISANLYSGSGTAGPIITAYNYADGGIVQAGDRGFVSYDQGNYYFFRKGPEDEEAGPVIHKGLRKPFSDLNGFDIAVSNADSIIDPDEVSSLTEYEKQLLVLGDRYSTVESISDSGMAEIAITTVYYTSDRSNVNPDSHCGYWASKSIDGDPFNHDIYYVSDAKHIICKGTDNIERDLSSTLNTLKEKNIKIYDRDGQSPDYSEISNVSDDGEIYGGHPLYSNLGLSHDDYVWYSGGGYKYGPLGVECEAADASVEDAPLTGTTASKYLCTYNAKDSNNVTKFTFTYNPVVRGFETAYNLLYNSYEVKTDGLYKRKIPDRCYKVSGNKLVNQHSVKDTATVTLQDILQDNTYRVKKSSGYRFYPGRIILKKDSNVSPDKASSDDTYYYVPNPDKYLTGNVTFTFTLSNSVDQTAKVYSPFNIFNGETYNWYSVKNLVTYNNSKVVIDKDSKGVKPFFSGASGNKEMLYYWSPDVDLSSVTYTFREFFKPTGEFVVNGREKTISLTGVWYPVTYDSTLGNYVLRAGQTENECFALYSSSGSVPINQSITFTFTLVQNPDVTLSIGTAIDRLKTIYWSLNNIYTKPNTPYYWTCPATNITCDVEPKLPELTIVKDTTQGAFTGYYWKVLEQQN